MSDPIPVPRVTTALRVRDLRKTYGHADNPVVAVDQVSLDLRPGEVLGLVGESGSGKSTIARMVSGLVPRTSGEIVIDGRSVPERPSRRDSVWLHKSVQMIFQDPFASLNPVHTIFHILARPLRIHSVVRRGQMRSRVLALLERVGLHPGSDYIDKRPHELSGGQRQRVGIARALAVEPTLILADEPTSMLDVSIRLDIMNLLLDIRDKTGVSILFITHDLAGAKYVSDRIAVMYRGNIVEKGDMEGLIRNPLHPYTQRLKKAAPQPGRPLTQSLDTEAGQTGALVPAHADGCAFAPNCGLRTPQCLTQLPPLHPVATGRAVRCVLHEPAEARQI